MHKKSSKDSEQGVQTFMGQKQQKKNGITQFYKTDIYEKFLRMGIKGSC